MKTANNIYRGFIKYTSQFLGKSRSNFLRYNMSDLDNYANYLNFLDAKLNSFFENQALYICCKKGCCKCCKKAQFPYSQIELKYLLKGLWQLSPANKKHVADNIKKLKQEKENFTGETFFYDCPFLINDACSVYEYRGIVCRSFGLIYTGADGLLKVPFCCFQGLNYANVLEDDGNKISAEKFKKLGYKEEPVAFNVSYEFLTDPDFARGYHFSFGEKKPLLEWFIQENKEVVEDSDIKAALNF